MARPTVEVVASGHLHYLPKVHHRDAIAHMAHDREVMGDEHVGEVELVLEVGEEVDHLGADRHGEGGHGLVGHDKFWLEREGACHPDPLALASREVRGEPVVVFGVEPHQFHEVLYPLLPLICAGLWLVDGEGIADDGPDPPARIERAVGVLEDHLHASAVGTQSPAAQA